MGAAKKEEKKWPADHVERRATDSLVPYARNSRTHSPEQIGQLTASMKEWGFTNPVLVDEAGGIIAGHGRIMAAQKLGLKEVPVMIAKGWTEAQKKAYVIADNKLALNSGWDDAMLKVEMEELQDLGFDLDLTGFNSDELALLLIEGDDDGMSAGGLTDKDDVPVLLEKEISKTGDVWILGNHRAMCGDSTKPEDVALLADGKRAALIHADPPYGMGKEGDGVANDNLYADKLDEFQMSWWRAFRPHAIDNASVYIWGNAENLWSLWFKGGLKNFEPLTFRNEITWVKDLVQGQLNDLMRSFANCGERCLFFMIGQQGFNNNSDNYWKGWDQIRLYLLDQRNLIGWNNKIIASFFGFNPRTADHWFSESQWSFITVQQYEILQKNSNGKAFLKSYDELKKEHDELKKEFYKTRAYFDNVHDQMTDSWQFATVLGEERQGHATPKPVAMMQRVMKSSLPPGGLCFEPFGGSGSTLMGAETTGRCCYTMEMQPMYVDVIVRRWEKFTGKKAALESTGQSFEDVKAERLGEKANVEA